MENRSAHTAKFFEAFEFTSVIDRLTANANEVRVSDLDQSEKENIFEQLVNEGNDELLGLYNTDVLFSEAQYKAPDEETSVIQPISPIGTFFGKYRGLRLINDMSSGTPKPKIMHNILYLDEDEDIYNPDNEGELTEEYYLLDIDHPDIDIMQAPLSRPYRRKPLHAICKDLLNDNPNGVTFSELEYMYQRILKLDISPGMQRKYVDWLLDRLDILCGLQGEKVKVHAHEYYKESEHEEEVVNLDRDTPLRGILMGFIEMPTYTRDHPFAAPDFSSNRTTLVACLDISDESEGASARVPLRRMASMVPALEEYGKS